MPKISRKLCEEILPLVEEAQRRCADIREYYARDRKSIVGKMSELLGQIGAHWCLIYCARKYGFGVENLAHWGGEINAFLSGFNSTKSKMGNDQKGRLKMATQAWSQTINDSQGFNSFTKEVSKKLYGEGITDKKIAQEAILAFVNSGQSIIQLMAMDAEGVERFINDLIGGEGDGNQVSQQGRGGRKRR